MTNQLNLNYIRELLDYDPNTGYLTNKVKGIRRAIGKRVGGNTCNPEAYRSIRIDGILYLEHRLVWYHYYGTWPTSIIDHINRNKSDNRISNLREVTYSQNAINKLPNNCLYRGVTLSSSGTKFKSQIRLNNILVYIGTFNSAKEASLAYESRAREHHKEFYINPNYTYNENI